VRSGVEEFPNVLFEITDKIVSYSLTKAGLNCSLVLPNPESNWTTLRR
jgi:hypothetical protein